TEDLLNDDARILGDEAREKMEAAPFVEQFFRKCEQHVAAGNFPAAKGDLDKARALDAEHPAIARMMTMVAGGAAPAPAAPPTPPPAAAPSFSFDAPAAPSAFDFGGGGSGSTPSFVVDQPSSAARSTADASDFGFTFEEEKPAMPSGGFSFDQVSSNPAPSRPAPPPTPPPAAAGFSFGAPDPAGFSFDGPQAKAPSSFDFQPPAAQPPAAGFSFDAPAPPAPAFSFDAPAASAPPAAGFNFNAPAPDAGAFSFGEPAAPEASGFGFGAPAAAGGFDFSTPAAGTDDQKKIEQYLADGDRAFNGGDYQHAIDLWSRIFLIDVTNESASDRIERAKGKRREVEHRVEALHDEATAAAERGDEAGARAKLNDVLQLDPGNTSALELLERLARNEKYEEEPIPPSSPDSFDDMFDDSRDSPFEDSVNEGAIIRPPDAAPPSSTPEKGKTETRVAATSRAQKSKVAGLLVPLIAAVVVLGGGYFAYTRFFAAPPVEQASGATAIKQATALAARGQYDQAMALLQEIKPDDPMHDKALELMADYQHSKAKKSELVNGRPAEQTFTDDVAAARVAYDGHDYITAKKLLDEASRVHPLPPDVKQIYDASAQQVSKLDSALSLFKEGKYQDAVTNLEPLLQQDPLNASVKQLLTNAHFNLGAQALQAEHIDEAVKQFDVVLAGNPADEAAKRSKDLAQKYQNQPKDLLYKIYVKYLPLR
ncbi:MAG: hypothetical protein JWO56_1983, partial [Acidobacteria bacterium]|nr:hypothetical protein [Acidobacteriota bacterium]